MALACRDAGAYNYANVKRWTNAAKLKLAGQASPTVLDCDRVIVPVHLPAHWTCAVIDLQRQELCYYDSMGVRLLCCPTHPGCGPVALAASTQASILLSC